MRYVVPALDLTRFQRSPLCSSFLCSCSADTKLDATFVNTNTHTPETVNITGKWPGDIVELFWRGHLVGLIMRQLTRRDMLGQNTVSLTCEQGCCPLGRC